MPLIRVLIADDHPVLLAGLRALLDAKHGFEVVGEAADGVEVSRKAKELRPDVVLMDLSMPGPPSGRVIRQVRRACPKARVLVLTIHGDAAYLAAALSAGAAGYMVKKVADTELVSAIRAVHGGRMFVDITQTVSPAQNPVAGKTGKERLAPKALSLRERKVLQLLARGYSNQQVADQLRVSVKTVETYRTRLRKKLGLKDRAELYRFAEESGLLDT